MQSVLGAGDRDEKQKYQYDRQYWPDCRTTMALYTHILVSGKRLSHFVPPEGFVTTLLRSTALKVIPIAKRAVQRFTGVRVPNPGGIVVPGPNPVGKSANSPM